MSKILQLKKISHHNPLEILCIPTCIKNILDNQFVNVYVSRKVINKWCCFDGKLQDIIGVDALEEHFAPKLLKNKKVKYFEKQLGKLRDIINLINQNIFCVILFKLEDYNKWKRKTNIEVEQIGYIGFHAMIVCGIDSSKEIVYLYDPIYDRYNRNKYISKDPLDLYDAISFLDFTRFWDRGFGSFMFWFEESKNIKNIRKKHKTLDNYQNEQK